MMKNGCLVLPLLATLAGCAALSQPRGMSDGFRVEQDYQGAYRRVLENARRCVPAATAAGQRDVQGTLDDRSQSGRVTLAYRGPDGAETRAVVSLSAADRTHTDVRIEGPDANGRAAKTVRGWLDGNAGDCP